MSLRIIATASTAQITEGSEVPFVVPASAFSHGNKPSVAIQGLGTGESVTIKKFDGADYQDMVNGELVYGTNGAAPFNSAGQYGFFKSATAVPVYLVLDDGR